MKVSNRKLVVVSNTTEEECQTHFDSSASPRSNNLRLRRRRRGYHGDQSINQPINQNYITEPTKNKQQQTF